jgi:ribonuclease D
MAIIPITDSNELAQFCEQQRGADFITVDTEFIRDHTYWPKLCLLQVAGPDDARIIDPLAPPIDMSPLFDLLGDAGVLKVFHAARQDLEIFFHLTGNVPTPIFDTQVAAMVCGFGDQASYEKLAAQLAGTQINKASRFTDWSRRPLTTSQLEYALADVTHLRRVHERLTQRLEKSGRARWLDEEMAGLTNPAIYRADPEDAWQRVKSRSGNARYLAVLKELAAWREREAQTRNVPRGRILRDEVLISIAGHEPKAVADLDNMRGLPKRFSEDSRGEEILAAVSRGLAIPDDKLPRAPQRKNLPSGIGPLTDMLKVLLKRACESHDVAPKLVASSSDLERIAASDDTNIPALHGWRREIFGEQALAFKRGKLAISVNGKRIELIETNGSADRPK